MSFIGSEEKCEKKVNKYKMRAEKSTDNTGFTISSNESEEEATKLNSNTVNPRNSNLLNKCNNWTLLNYDKINNCFNFTVGSSTRYEEEISRVDVFIQASRRTTISNDKSHDNEETLQAEPPTVVEVVDASQFVVNTLIEIKNIVTLMASKQNYLEEQLNSLKKKS